jgi:hypothetical protein
MTIEFNITEKKTTAQRYWVKRKLPAELIDLNMKQIDAVRRMVQAAFIAGKRDAAGR